MSSCRHYYEVGDYNGPALFACNDVLSLLHTAESLPPGDYWVDEGFTGGPMVWWGTLILSPDGTWALSSMTGLVAGPGYPALFAPSSTASAPGGDL